MCLSKVDNIYNPPLEEERYAWKVFETIPYQMINRTEDSAYKHSWSFQYFPFHSGLICSRRVPRGRWLIANRGEIYADDTRPYQAGFHCYASEEVARSEAASFQLTTMVVCKVRIRNVIADGRQGVSRVIVAREMYVPSEEDLKDPIWSMDDAKT